MKLPLQKAEKPRKSYFFLLPFVFLLLPCCTRLLLPTILNHLPDSESGQPWVHKPM